MTDEQEPEGFVFPCDYQVKAMGLDDGLFKDVVVEILSKHCHKIDYDSIECVASKNGKYVSVRVTIQAQSKEHLDCIYDELTSHEKVLMRL